MYTKDFDLWHGIKKNIDKEAGRLFYKEREVWWCSLGVNVGYELDGKGENYNRPVLILKGFSREVCLSIPLTTKLKTGKYYHEVSLGDDVVRKAVLSQLRLLDTKRFLQKIGTVENNEFLKIKQAVIALLQ